MMHPYPVLGQVIPNHALLPHLLCRFGRFGEPTFLFAIFLIFYRRTLYPVIQLWIPTPLLQTHTHTQTHAHTHTHTHATLQGPSRTTSTPCGRLSPPYSPPHPDNSPAPEPIHSGPSPYARVH